jgi:hypothetical protein
MSSPRARPCPPLRNSNGFLVREYLSPVWRPVAVEGIKDAADEVAVAVVEVEAGSVCESQAMPRPTPGGDRGGCDFDRGVSCRRCLDRPPGASCASP